MNVRGFTRRRDGGSTWGFVCRIPSTGRLETEAAGEPLIHPALFVLEQRKPGLSLFQRKDNLHASVYPMTMKPVREQKQPALEMGYKIRSDQRWGGLSEITSQTLVQEVLDNWSYLAQFFIQKRLDCVGCIMTRFCTLEEVSRQYEIGCEDFIAEMKERIKKHEGN